MMASAQPVGNLLRKWRQRRGLSQLHLSCDAEISTRYLSFLENGRSQPSREMVLHLAAQLDVPLRQRRAELDHTKRFLERVDAMLKHPREVARTEMIG